MLETLGSKAVYVNQRDEEELTSLVEICEHAYLFSLQRGGEQGNRKLIYPFIVVQLNKEEIKNICVDMKKVSFHVQASFLVILIKLLLL